VTTRDTIMKAYLAVVLVRQIHTDDICGRLCDCSKPSSDVKLFEKKPPVAAGMSCDGWGRRK
jgi:hypothetical protein